MDLKHMTAFGVKIWLNFTDLTVKELMLCLFHKSEASTENNLLLRDNRVAKVTRKHIQHWIFMPGSYCMTEYCATHCDASVWDSKMKNILIMLYNYNNKYTYKNIALVITAGQAAVAHVDD